LAWHDWIETIFRFDPDHHNGSFEWELVGACVILTITASVLARREWKTARLASA
jgi:hypothetical protein